MHKSLICHNATSVIMHVTIYNLRNWLLPLSNLSIMSTGDGSTQEERGFKVNDIFNDKNAL